MTLRDDEAWMAFGLCRGDQARYFYPEKNDSITHARNTCNACPVREVCLDFALTHDEKHGIWGGKTERERRILKRRRSAHAS